MRPELPLRLKPTLRLQLRAWGCNKRHADRDADAGAGAGAGASAGASAGAGARRRRSWALGFGLP